MSVQNTTAGKMGADDKDYLGMRVNLIGEDGYLDTLLLPHTAEGRYYFSHKNNRFLSVEAMSGLWTLCCDSESSFAGMLSTEFSQVPLVLHQMYFPKNHGRQYLLYAEAITEKSSVFHNYRVPFNTYISFGRDSTNNIACDSNFISHQHAYFRLTESGWEVYDMNSVNGIYVNHCRVSSARLKLGDMVYLMGPRVLVGSNFLSICSGDVHTIIDSSVLFPLKAFGDGKKAASNSGQDALYNRGPRSRYSMEWPTVSVDAPPMPMNANKMPLVLRMGPTAVMSGQSMIMGNYSMLLSSLVFPFLTQRYTEKERKEYEERRHEKYGEYLELKKHEIEQECKHELKVLNANYPDLSNVLYYCDGSTPRLWERRNTDDDFLVLRVGFGTIPMCAALDYPKERFQMEQDDLEVQMYSVVQQKYTVSNAPVMHALLKNYVCGVVGDRPYVLAFMRGLLAQLVMTHSYDEVKCIFLMDRKELSAFHVVRYLPHVWDDERTIRFLATSQPGASAIGEYLRREMEGAFGSKSDTERYRRTHPYYVVFAFSRALYDSMEVLKDVLAENRNIGLSVIAAFEQQPKECTCIFQMNSTGVHQVYDLLHPDDTPQKFQLDLFSEELFSSSMKKLANTNLMTIAGSYSLPKTFTFLEMFGVGKVEHLNLLKRWADSDPTRSLATPVGIGTDGSLFMLDLHEKRQGPHGLVAGMTGSGKSEFIITYILSMAVNFSPDEVAFLLIDYKGGGLTGAFEDPVRGVHLPHLVGTITNLDGAAVARSMVSIESELKRRQRIFNETKSLCNEGTLDIYDYQRLYRNHRVKEPLPHLFIISDEFAELKSQQPEFMDKLISTARIGRSLGVHLILATQKPSGVVNDQIWSNTKFRVCLRVQDAGDSNDMLKRPDAAELKDTGRFYLQVGYNEYFAMGQSAWCGADYIPQDTVVQQKDESVQVIDDTAQTILSAKPIVQKKKSELKQIVAVVQYLSALAQREQILPRTLLPPPLPVSLTLQQLQERTSNEIPQKISALVGLIDDPAYQKQYPLELNLQESHHVILVGESGCGKTAFVQTMLLNLVHRYTPKRLNFYILDFSSHLLHAFKALPHCGAVLTEENEGDILRLFAMISEETERRKKLFEKAEVNSYSAYCKNHELPLWVIVVDNLGALSELGKAKNIYLSLNEYMQAGAPYGIKFVLTGLRYNTFSIRVRQESEVRLAMQQKDKYAYGDILDKRNDYIPPTLAGRGMCIWDERPLEFQCAEFTDEADEQKRNELLKQAIACCAEQHKGNGMAQRLQVLSDTETYEEFLRRFEPGRIPIGYETSRIKPIALPLKQMYSLSVYCGNPEGAPTIMANLIAAYRREGMELLIVKRVANSLFDDPNSQLFYLNQAENVSFLRCVEEDTHTLLERLLREMKVRKGLRQEYCNLHNLDIGDPSTMLQAADYVCAHSTPLMVFFEGFVPYIAALTKAEKQKEAAVDTIMMEHIFAGASSQEMKNTSEAAIRRRGIGYGIYYTAFYGPNEVSAESIAQIFNPQRHILLLGGQYDKQTLENHLPESLRSQTEPQPYYNKGIMIYGGKGYSIQMPCGDLRPKEDPDFASIF